MTESTESSELSDVGGTISTNLNSSLNTSKSSDILSTEVTKQFDRNLIIDCSAISHIDSMGVEVVWEVFKDGIKCGVAVKFADFSETVLQVFTKCGLFTTIPKTNFYPTVHEAVLSVSK